MAHALVLGAVGLTLTLIGLVTTWDKGPEFGPKWYPIALVILSMPQSWAGAKIAERRAQAARG
jgi:hypothetical protein